MAVKVLQQVHFGGGSFGFLGFYTLFPRGFLEFFLGFLDVSRFFFWGFGERGMNLMFWAIALALLCKRPFVEDRNDIFPGFWKANMVRLWVLSGVVWTTADFLLKAKALKKETFSKVNALFPFLVGFSRGLDGDAFRSYGLMAREITETTSPPKTSH